MMQVATAHFQVHLQVAQCQRTAKTCKRAFKSLPEKREILKNATPHGKWLPFLTSCK